MDSAPLSTQIRALRLNRGWSLADLARRAGTSAPTLHRYESGWDRFEVATLRRLAAALGARLEIRLEPIRAGMPDSGPSTTELVHLLTPLFWDRPLRESDLEQYPQWVLRRVLMYGDKRQVEASRHHFGDDALRAAAAHRETDRRTRNYWRLILGPDAHESQSPQP